MFEDRLPVTLVDVFLLVMRMADHDVRLGEFGQQVEHAVVVLVALVRHARTPAEGNVRAEDHELVLVYVRQVLAQPFELPVGDAALVLFLAFVEDVVHRHDVHVAAVERIVARAELRFEIGRGIVVRSLGLQMVVVADGLEDGQVAIGHRLLHVAPQVGRVEDDVAERDAVDRRALGLVSVGRSLDVGDRLVDVAADLGRGRTLRVGDADQREIAFRGRQRRQHEVVAVGDVLMDDLGVEERVVVCRRVDGIPCRRAVMYEARLLVALHLVDAVGIGRDAAVAVRHDHTRDGVPRRVGHQSVEGCIAVELRAVDFGFDSLVAVMPAGLVVAACQHQRRRHTA